MAYPFNRDDLFGPGKLDAVLDLDIDLAADDPMSDEWLDDAATAVAVVAIDLKMQVARASALGFGEDLATTVLNDENLQAQLRRHWADNGVSSFITARAAEATPLGRMHAQLVDIAGVPTDSVATVTPIRISAIDNTASAAKTDDDTGTNTPDNVTRGPWLVSPQVGTTRAAAAGDYTPEQFTATRPEWGLTFIQTATANGDAVIEIRFAPGSARGLDLVRIEVDGVVRLLVLRERGSTISASATVRGTNVWGEQTTAVSNAFAAADLPVEDVDLVTETVRQAPGPERKRWREVARALPPGHLVAAAIQSGLT